MGDNIEIQEYYDNWENQSYLATLMSGIALMSMIISLLAYTREGFFPICLFVIFLGMAPLLVLISFMLISLAKEANTFIVLNESHRESSADIKRNIKYSVITNIITIALFFGGVVALYEKFPI